MVETLGKLGANVNAADKASHWDALTGMEISMLNCHIMEWQSSYLAVCIQSLSGRPSLVLLL